MKNILSLCDDGTMDTVFHCEHCSRELRYSGVERDSKGYIPDEEFSRIEAEHADECEGPEDLSYPELASRWHGGQWSALYAFLSTGTVLKTLSSEIRSVHKMAEKTSHPAEIEALENFAEWAEQEEAKKFPAE